MLKLPVVLCCVLLSLSNPFMARAQYPCRAQRVVDQLPYIDDHGQPKLAITNGLHQTALGTGWSDPVWSVVSQGGPYDFLTYRGADGGVWQTKIHVSGNSKSVAFESKHPGEGNGRNGSFLIHDPVEGIWEVTGLIFVSQNNSQTDFTVRFCLAHPQAGASGTAGGGGGGGHNQGMHSRQN